MTESKKAEQKIVETKATEIDEQALDVVHGGLARSGGDDDLDDLEVERIRRR